MGSQLALVNKKAAIGTQSINKPATDEYIRRYQISTMNAIENILNMGEAVYEIYWKSRSGELSKDDLEYFCKSVSLDSKGSTFRKYKAIGQNAIRFRECMERLPCSFSVLYEMATLSGDEFERFMSKTTVSKDLTLEQFKKIIAKSTVLTKNKMINLPVRGYSFRGIAKIMREINLFPISIMRNTPESKFNEIVEFLNKCRNEGYIRFEDPQITEYEADLITLENQCISNSVVNTALTV